MHLPRPPRIPHSSLLGWLGGLSLNACGGAPTTSDSATSGASTTEASPSSLTSTSDESSAASGEASESAVPTSGPAPDGSTSATSSPTTSGETTAGTIMGSTTTVAASTTGDSTGAGETTADASDTTGSNTTGSDTTGEGPDTTGDASVCGDGLLAELEQCDDGNQSDADGCGADCTWTATLSASYLYTCGVSPAGGVHCWGSNMSHRLGYPAAQGSIGDMPGELPPPEVTLGDDVVAKQVTTGDFHTCALSTAGRIQCWGMNVAGQLCIGDNSLGNSVIGDDPGEMPPASVDLGPGVAARQVVAGAYATFALTEAGVVRSWGSNSHGQLGLGHVQTIGDEPGEVPPPIVDLGVGVRAKQIAVGHYFACALTTDGEVKCWGSNEDGQLGIGSVEDVGDEPGEMPPLAVDLGGVKVHQLSLGHSHVCAVTETQALKCWGKGSNGALGSENSSTLGDQPGEMPPPDVDLGDLQVDRVACGLVHTCVTATDGQVYCWGTNQTGALGLEMKLPNILGDQPNEMPPVTGTQVGGVAVQLAPSRMGTSPHTCALLADAAVTCWGGNGGGQLGLGHTLAVGDDPGEMPPPATAAW